MTMLADTAESKLDFAELQKALAEAGELSGVNVSIQREDVFNLCTACSEQAAGDSLTRACPCKSPRCGPERSAHGLRRQENLLPLR